MKSHPFVLSLLILTGCNAGYAATCESLQDLKLNDVRIKAATAIAPAPEWSAGPGSTPIKLPFCRVEGTIEKEIEFELWLPLAASWNRKFLGAGVGGDAGTFNLRDLPRGVTRGYAAATTDTGHKSTDKQWMLGEPMRLTNFEHRANHLLVEKSRQIIAAYYARPAERAYFIGCSGGGRQGLKEMQRYPNDYDGIIAGAPGPKTQVMSTRRLWEINLNRRTKALMADSDWQMVAEAGAKVCDIRDGVQDGVAEDPRGCSFDPVVLQCKSTDEKNCLSAEQVKVAQTIYASLKDENGQLIDDGLLPGVRVSTAAESKLAPALFGQAVHKDANWDLTTFNIASDLAAIDRVMPELKADQVELSAFKQRGGKAILYQGWMDPAVPAQMTVRYVEEVQKTMGGEAAASDFFRLFMAPGVFHCQGGPGPDRFGGAGGDGYNQTNAEGGIVDADHDLLSALERWVEEGRAPDRIIAAKLDNGKLIRTRPLCVYPATAHYQGSGSTDDAANFVCRKD